MDNVANLGCLALVLVLFAVYGSPRVLVAAVRDLHRGAQRRGRVAKYRRLRAVVRGYRQSQPAAPLRPARRRRR